MSIFTRYDQLELIGVGSSGSVYRAREGQNGIEYAIKILDMSSCNEEVINRQQFSQLYHEASILMQLSHPNISQLVDFDADQEYCYLVTRLVQGISLAQWLEQSGAMPVWQLLTTAIQISHPLKYLHQRGLIHGDIKPANIMLAATGVIKLLDYGAARLLKQKRSIEQLTLKYAAPEQIESSHGDVRSDLFSLGVTLYELGRGTHPFPAMRQSDLIAEITSFNPTPLTESITGFPQAFSDVIQRLLSKDPEKRFQTAEALRIALWNCLARHSC